MPACAAMLRGEDGQKAEGEEASEIKLQEVMAALQEMAKNKAAGPDDLHPRLLRRLPPEAIEVVRRFFNRSLREGVVPQKWRMARIVLFLKQGKNAEEVGSYRPVSLTSCMGKWFERVALQVGVGGEDQ